MAGQRPSTKNLPSAENKAELRAAVLDKRDELTAEAARAGSLALCERLDGVAPLAGYHAIAGYASIRNEIDLSQYLAARQRAGARLYFPRVTGPGSMVFAPVDGLDELEAGSFGVPEPAGEPAALGDIELFFVPGVAFDRHGRRLGFGRGFYDRALAEAIDQHPDTHPADKPTPLLVGICYQWQLLEGDIPVEPHDIAMDVIATDQELIYCSHGRLT